MLLGNKLIHLRNLLETADKQMEALSPISRRMLAIGIISEMNFVVSLLEEELTNMDIELNDEQADIDIDGFCDFISGNRQLQENLFNEKLYRENVADLNLIDSIADLFSIDKNSDKKADLFVTGMKYICSDINLYSRDIAFALNKGIGKIVSLLLSMKDKMKNISDYLYESYCENALEKDICLYSNEVLNDLDDWMEEHEINIGTLTNKRTQELYKFLNCKFFLFAANPTRGEINQSIKNLPEDALEIGMSVSDELKIECAKFSNFIVMNEGIMILDKVKLGKYIFKNKKKLTEEHFHKIRYFYFMLTSLHTHMAEINPRLKKYIVDADENESEELFNKAYNILKSCETLLRTELPEDTIKEILEAAFVSDISNHLKAKLKGQSFNTVLCAMISSIHLSSKIFKIGTTVNDIADVLAQSLTDVSKETIVRYMRNTQSNQFKTIIEWTGTYIKENYYSKSEQAFVSLSKG